MSLGPELSSMTTALSDLATRLARLADELQGTDRNDVAIALYEVERSLGAAHRRLQKVVTNLD